MFAWLGRHLSFGAALAIACGLLSTWEVSEQDVYWQIRAGDELLRTGRFPETETWSFAAQGQPWMNLPWLAGVIFRAAYVGGAPGLVLFRGLLVALLVYLLAGLVRQERATTTPAWVLEGALLPVAYVAMAFRLELRADTLVLIVFAAVLLCRRRLEHATPWLYPAFVALAANLHPGTAPFVVVVAAYVLVRSSLPWRRFIGPLVALVPAYFLQAYPVRVLPFLRRHLFYFEGQVLENPDHQRLDLAHHLDIERFGLSGVAWLLLSGLALYALGSALIRAGRGRQRLGAALELVLFAGLLGLAVERIRAIPYAVVFGLPFASRALEKAIAAMRDWRSGPVARALLPLFASGLLLPYHALTTRRVFGLRDSATMYPIGAVRFIKEHGIAKNVYHTFAFGAYIVWHLRDYPDFVDPRETPFRHLEQDYLEAYRSPEHARRLYERYGVNAVLVPIPETALVPGRGYRDIIEEWLPAANWALVYFDEMSVLVVRRIPEHAGVIAEHEYKHLRPNLPPGNFLVAAPRTRAEIQGFKDDVRRCLAVGSADGFCHASERVLLDIERAIEKATRSAAPASSK